MRANTNTALRTPETWERYQNEPRRPQGTCFMCDANAITIVREYSHWLIIENNFPYDAVAEISHLLIPKRHFNFKETMELEEAQQLKSIEEMADAEQNYDCILKNFSVGQSQPQHAHYHLIKWIRTNK